MCPYGPMPPRRVNSLPACADRHRPAWVCPASQGASQAMLIATGLSWEDLNKPQVGIGAVWYDGNPCNMHLADLGSLVKRGVEQAGMVPMRFNTVGVSDGISMGTDGMS